MLPSKTHYNVMAMACCLQDAEYIQWKPPSKQWAITITHGEDLQDSEGWGGGGGLQAIGMSY